MKPNINVLFLFLIAGISMTSCVKEKSFPVEPVIEFKEYIKYGLDSANCIITFKDGDGDIGLLAGDSIPDLKMKYLFKDTAGIFHPYDQSMGSSVFDTLFYTYRVPNITPDGQYKALDGEILIRLRSHPLYNPQHHIVKFEIRLKDRAGHLSNMATTNEINIP